MKIMKEEIETFEYTEFVTKYVSKLQEYYSGQGNNYVFKMIINDSPKDFFDSIENSYLNSNFKELIRTEYGELWVSEKGFLDFDAINLELKKILKANGYVDNNATKILYYLYIDIIKRNKKYHKPLIALFNKTFQSRYNDFDVTPVPKEYRNLSKYFKEYANEIKETSTKNEELIELFSAAESLITDDISSSIIKSIKDIVLPSPEKTETSIDEKK